MSGASNFVCPWRDPLFLVQGNRIQWICWQPSQEGCKRGLWLEIKSFNEMEAEKLAE